MDQAYWFPEKISTKAIQSEVNPSPQIPFQFSTPNTLISKLNKTTANALVAHRSFVHLFFNKIQNQNFAEHDTIYVTDTTSFSRPRKFPFLCCLRLIATSVQASHKSFQWFVYIAMRLYHAFRSKNLRYLTFHSIMNIELFSPTVI